MGDRIIFHLALIDDWARAVAAGDYRISTRGALLSEVGFIHCSRADQVAGVAQRFYGGAGPLVLLYIDRERVRAEVRDDDVPGTGDAYPHIYGPLNLDAVIATCATEPAHVADSSWCSAPEELVVGVTGHRHLVGAHDVELRVGALTDVLSRRGGASGWRLVSSLAEGADRLVARQALLRGASLDVVLPLEEAEYAKDFETAASLEEFEDLLDGADSIAVTGTWPDGTRERAYANAGGAMLQRCQVLVALWDGEPPRGLGGTAEVIAAATAEGIETIVVPVGRAISG